MKKALFVALVVVVLLTGLPIMMGMGHAANCHDCGPAVVGSACVAVLFGAIGLLVALLVTALGPTRLDLFGRLDFATPERPPQLI